MSEQSYTSLREAFLSQMNFISDLGSKLCIYPFLGRSKRVVYCYYVLRFLVFFTATQLFVTVCISGFGNWFEIINVAPNFGVCLMITIQYTKIHTHRKLYDRIFKHFQSDLWDIVTDSTDHRAILHRYSKTSTFITQFMFIYSIILSVIITIFPQVIMYIESDVLGKETKHLYPFDGWYPFDKVQWYYVAYIWESFITVIVVFIFAFVNMIHISFTRYICMELKILGSITKGVISSNDVVELLYGRNAKVIYGNIKRKLKIIIRRHQFLSQVTLELESVFGDAMLLTYIFGSVFICLTVFTATVVEDVYMSLRYFSFFFSLLVEVFVQCIMGQLLINHSEKLELAIYFMDWTYADAATKRMLLFFLMRTQKPFKFTAKGYLTMDLCTYCNICSFSYQLFNLLRTAYDQ